MKTQNELLVELIKKTSIRLIEVEKLLTDLDSPIGDGDFGAGMKLGFQSVLEKLPSIEGQTSGKILRQIGLTLTSSTGGTSGAIFGTGFMRLGKSIGDRETVTMVEIAAALMEALEAMKARGEGTVVGDKTLVDALEPAVMAFGESADKGESTLQTLERALAAAKEGSDSTIPLIARKGRASYLGERSVGHRDAGSMAIYFMFEAAVNYFKEEKMV